MAISSTGCGRNGIPNAASKPGKGGRNKRANSSSVDDIGRCRVTTHLLNLANPSGVPIDAQRIPCNPPESNGPKNLNPSRGSSSCWPRPKSSLGSEIKARSRNFILLFVEFIRRGLIRCCCLFSFIVIINIVGFGLALGLREAYRCLKCERLYGYFERSFRRKRNLKKRDTVAKKRHRCQ